MGLGAQFRDQCAVSPFPVVVGIVHLQYGKTIKEKIQNHRFLYLIESVFLDEVVLQRLFEHVGFGIAVSVRDEIDHKDEDEISSKFADDVPGNSALFFKS